MWLQFEYGTCVYIVIIKYLGNQIQAVFVLNYF